VINLGEYIAKVRQQLDRDLVSTVSVRLSGTVVAALTAILLVRYLTPQEQGYWYTFGSILSIAAFAEMGAGQILMRFVAREQAGLNKSESASILRLRSLYRFGFKLGLGVASLTTLIAIPIGLWWISDNGKNEIDWRSPWLLAALASAPAIFMGFANAYFEGWQFVTAANVRRSIASWLSLASLFAAFSAGLGLFAFGISRIVSALYGLIQIGFSHGNLIKKHQLNIIAESNFKPRKEFWPLQVRYGMTWATGIFVNGLYAPLIFKFDGPIAAGQYGMSLSVVAIISGISTSLIGARQAKLAALSCNGNKDEMRKLLNITLKLSIVSFFVGSLILGTTVIFTPEVLNTYTQRLLSPLNLSILIAAQFFWLLITIYTTFVRSFNTEPFVKLAWIHAFFTLIVGIPAIVFFKTTGILLICLVGNIGSAIVCRNLARLIQNEHEKN